mmetsp:Transcript_25684/g.44987  ORF Transcript_25684/g.44987 Transcript_25684/m.44987 type:complete len:195 (-) Transcript_25684:8328-8912(-)
MRFYKDSLHNVNPRAFYWYRQDLSQRRHKLLPFSIIRYCQGAIDRFGHFGTSFYFHYNPFIEGLSMHRNREFLQSYNTKVFLAGALGFVVVNAVLLFETRLWKERKWDEEPGCRIPLRNRHAERLYNQVVNVWLLPNLMYYGLIVADRDLNPSVDANQISGGRRFRHFLVAEYVRKEKLKANRDTRYDFLELAP